MKVLVTGGSGLLGSDVCMHLKERGIEHAGVNSSDLDIRDESAVKKYFKEYRPDYVIHCAGYTAVDKAEDERSLCMDINANGTKYISEECLKIGSKFMYISTDYVFDGTGNIPYEVDDRTCPLNVYGRSKLHGEQAVRSTLKEHFIIRTSWLFGTNGNNFVKSMLRLAKDRREIKVVDDQIGSPTYTYDLAALLIDIVFSNKFGTFHITNEGFCSWADFARAIFAGVGILVDVENIPSSAYPTKAVRPNNSRLSKSRLDDCGFTRLPNWQDALKKYLAEIQ